MADREPFLETYKKVLRASLLSYVDDGTINALTSYLDWNNDIAVDVDSRILKLENNETIYQVFGYVGKSSSGQITIPTEATIFDLYGDGILDAILVVADENNNPTEENSLNSLDEIVQVTSLDNNGIFVLDSVPVNNSCIIYFIKINDAYKINVPVDSIIPPGIQLDAPILNTIVVAKLGGDYNTIEGALNSITDNSPTNRYIIEVHSGIYIENNPLVLKTYVTIIGAGSNLNTRITASNPALNLFETENVVGGFGFIENVALSGTDATHAALHNVNQFELVGKSITFIDCGICVHLNNAGGTTDIQNVTALTISGTIDKFAFVEAGTFVATQWQTVGQSTVNTVFHITGPNSTALLTDLKSFSANVNLGLRAEDGCKVIGKVAQAEGFYDGLKVSGTNTDVSFSSLTLHDIVNDALTIENVGTNVRVTFFGSEISNPGNLSLNILNPNAVVVGSGVVEINKVYAVTGSKIFASIIDLTEEDEGYNIFGELRVGYAEKGAESAIGEGDSYTRGMLVYTQSSGGVFADVSTEARGLNGDTFTFPGVGVNNAIYVASSLSGVDKLDHYGIKTSVTIAAIYGTGSIIIEYWNGSIWEAVSGMEAESGGKYLPNANNYFQKTGSHQIRYCGELAADSWTKNDPIVPALGTTYFWVRYRIASTVTVAPTFDQFKLHTSRFEVNSDGWIEYFGKSRPTAQLGLNFTTAEPFEGAMQSQTIYVNENIGVGLTNNKFTATGDKTGISGFLPFDFDTSSPLKLQWSGRASDTQTIEWTVRAYWVTDGDIYYLTEPAPIAGSKTVVVSKAIIAAQVSVFEAEIDVKEMVSRRDGGFGDQIFISLQPSVMTGTFSLVSSQAIYTRWCEGGHI